MKPIIVTLAILWPILLFSQQSKELISNSGYQESSEYNISASLGQSFVQQSYGDYSLSEGFQQYFENEEYLVKIPFKTLIYPNPTTNSVNLRSDTEIVHLTIYNDIGATIQSIRNLFQTEYQVQLNPLKSGVYFFELEFKGGAKSMKKIVKI